MDKLDFALIILKSGYLFNKFQNKIEWWLNQYSPVVDIINRIETFIKKDTLNNDTLFLIGMNIGELENILPKLEVYGQQHVACVKYLVIGLKEIFCLSEEKEK
jgi:hypothetical protein